MSKHIRILYTIPNFKTAGSQYVLLSIFSRIDKSIFDPFVAVERFPESIPDIIPVDRRLVVSFDKNRYTNIAHFRDILREKKIDIVHSWDYKPNYLEPLACNLSGVKYLYTKKNNAWSKRWKLKTLLANHIAYDNPDMKSRFFSNVLFKSKITFIPHGVNTELFSPLPKIENSTFNIISIGNIAQNKNQLFIIDSLTTLPKKIVLHLYGNESKEYRQVLDSFINKNNLEDRVIFHNYISQEDIPEIFRKMDLFVLSSVNEGLPVCILEAMACGVPVLSSDSGGGAKFLLPPEHIFSLNDPSNFREKILKIYEMKGSELQSWANKNVNKVKESHTIETEVSTYENLYKNLIKFNVPI